MTPPNICNTQCPKPSTPFSIHNSKGCNWYDKSANKHLLPLNNSKYNTRGHDMKLEKNRFNCKLRQCSFSIRVTNIWNSLSNRVTNANSIDNFKKLLDEELHHLKYVFD